jgi:hypothetical protein
MLPKISLFKWLSAMEEMLVMTKIFVDTWFIVVLINKRDQYHVF